LAVIENEIKSAMAHFIDKRKIEADDEINVEREGEVYRPFSITKKRLFDWWCLHRKR
jgi:hypothetical protein